MTDAQEIIAPDGKALIAEAITDYFGERCDGFETTCMTCQAWASWDRILGKDEVDPVTVEKCAEVTEMYISMGWRGTEITEAILALSRATHQGDK